MKPLSSRNRFFYLLSVSLRRFRRNLKWRFGNTDYAMTRDADRLSHSVVSHKSLLLRKLSGADMELQRNKVKSLSLACSLVDSVVVRPGETFSLWRLVGKPSAGRGFLPGLQLSFGNLVSMSGGGLCQLSNLLHWMVLQTPMTVVERHRHATDPFPDHKRKVPFGTGATVFYNYLDFSFRNDTSCDYQIRVKTGDEYLEGEILSDMPPEHLYRVYEKKHRFVRNGSFVYRENELWREKTEAVSGRVVSEDLIMRNRCRVLYEVPEEDISG
ncbi:vancomycin resistance protein [Candidatus Fermentibacteria bacterium]|nr:MAG: vancomycin resistance protein [Candidatus Fermentibacteria bacterium]